MATNTTANPYRAPHATVADQDDEDEFQEVNAWSTAGRIGRARYIVWTFGATILVYLVMGVLAALGATGLIGILGAVGGLALMVFSIMLTIQRCHDFDMSGWLTLIILIPLAALAFWFVPGTKGSNRWGPRPEPNSKAVIVGAWVLGLLVPVIGILAAIAIPQYQQYVERARATQDLQQQR